MDKSEKSVKLKAIDILYQVWSEWESKGIELPDEMLSELNSKIYDIEE